MKEIETSKLTERNQTTIPKSVRTVLGLHGGERVGYVIEGDQVKMVNATAKRQDDPVLGSFLDFLARDIEAHPERLAAFPADLFAEAQRLTEGIKVDHDSPIDGVDPL